MIVSQDAGRDVVWPRKVYDGLSRLLALFGSFRRAGEPIILRLF